MFADVKAFMKRLLLYLLLISFISISHGLVGCANMIPPSGGPRDSIPPLLVSASPEDSTTRFPGGKIVLTFNEFVELNKPNETIIVSPFPKHPANFESHLRTVTIRLKDTLEPNTTYAIDFGRAIRDINEGNELKGYNYIFTTGNHFDSLTLRGRVLLAQTGKADSTLTVMLHTHSYDSAVAKERPRYIARLDSAGYFDFHNLPAGTFAIFALHDEGGTMMYTSEQQLFAFADQPVVVNRITEPVILYAFAKPEEPKPAPAIKPTTKAAQDKLLRLQPNLESGQLDLLSQLEISFNDPIKTLDTSKMQLTNEVFAPFPNVNYQLDSTRKKLMVQTNWVPGRGYSLIFQKDFAEDSAGRKLLRNDTLSFRTKNTSDYGGVRLRFLNIDLSKHPVLQFVQTDQVKYSHVFTDRIASIKMFHPGEYDLRVLYDDNQNGKWDPGDYYKHKQPEKVQAIQRKLNIKPNWDNEADITL
jgi:hypothetical protein